jgi:hypothetical protein
VRCAGLWAARVRAGGAATNVGGGVHQGVAQLGTVPEGGRLVVLGDEGALDGRYGTVFIAGPTCAQHVHPSLRQTPCHVGRPPFQVRYPVRFSKCVRSSPRNDEFV